MNSRVASVLAGLLCVTSLPACGAGDEVAPPVEPPTGPCPGVEDFLPDFFGLLRGGELEPLRELIEEEVVAGGTLRRPTFPQLFEGLIEILRRLPGDDPLERFSGIESLMPAAARVLRVALSDANACSTAPSADCPRLSGLLTLGRVIETCGDEPPRAPESLGGGAALMRFFSLTVELLAESNPGTRTPLRTLEELLVAKDTAELLRLIDVEEQVGTEGFAVLLRRILETLADERFEYAEITDLMDSFVLPLAERFLPTLVRPLEELVALGAQLLEPPAGQAAGLQPVMQPLSACILAIEFPRGEDGRLTGEGGYLSALLYDVIVEEELGSPDGLAGLIGAVSTLVEAGLDDAGTRSLLSILDYLATTDPQRDALLGVLGAAFSLPYVEGVGTALLALVESDFVQEITDATTAIRGGCGLYEEPPP